MNTKLFFSVGLAILVIVSVFVVNRLRQTDPWETDAQIHSDTRGKSTVSVADPSIGRPSPPTEDSIRRSSSRSGTREAAIELSIHDLIDRGFEITADRIGRIVAEGNVKLRSPSGSIAQGDELRESSTAGEYMIFGNPRIQQGDGLLVAGEPNLYIRVGPNKFYCSPGKWKTFYQKSDQQNQPNKLQQDKPR